VTDAPRTPKDWASLLQHHWEERARSPSRDFYVASHPGWSDSEAWARQAETDTALFLHGLEADWLAPAHVLEIGCGVGRLAGPLRSRTRSYTGVDIAASMVEEATRRHAGADDVRFLVGDGLGVPAEAGDRRYRLALAVAVFIHCPPDVIESLVRGAYELLEPGGELRFQLRADPEDPEGIEGAPDVAAQDQALAEHERQVQEMEGEATLADMSLIEGQYYMGHAFRYAEAAPFLEAATGGDVTVMRFDPVHLYGWVRKA
jgi:SAM-dependent methyltransferase